MALQPQTDEKNFQIKMTTYQSEIQTLEDDVSTKNISANMYPAKTQNGECKLNCGRR